MTSSNSKMVLDNLRKLQVSATDAMRAFHGEDLTGMHEALEHAASLIKGILWLEVADSAEREAHIVRGEN